MGKHEIDKLLVALERIAMAQESMAQSLLCLEEQFHRASGERQIYPEEMN